MTRCPIRNSRESCLLSEAVRWPSGPGEAWGTRSPRPRPVHVFVDTAAVHAHAVPLRSPAGHDACARRASEQRGGESIPEPSWRRALPNHPIHAGGPTRATCWRLFTCPRHARGRYEAFVRAAASVHFVRSRRGSPRTAVAPRGHSHSHSTCPPKLPSGWDLAWAPFSVFRLLAALLCRTSDSARVCVRWCVCERERHERADCLTGRSTTTNSDTPRLKPVSCMRRGRSDR